jgi:hypothetical protein
MTRVRVRVRVMTRVRPSLRVRVRARVRVKVSPNPSQNHDPNPHLVAQAFGAEEPESKSPKDQLKRLGRKALRAMLPAAALAALTKLLDTRRDRHRKEHHLSADAADVVVSKVS